MKNIQLNEGLDYHDLEGQLDPVVSVDEYAANMGKDSDIVTIAFIIRSEQAGNDLVDWFEKGYDWVLDAQVSEGEISPGKYLVFVELNRRSSVPERIIELLHDMETLTNIPLNDWTVTVNEEEYAPDAEQLRQVITISPHEYRETEEEESIENEEELNEMRVSAGIPVKSIYNANDAEMKAFKALAGL
jgi:hypothetical protein